MDGAMVERARRGGRTERFRPVQAPAERRDAGRVIALTASSTIFTKNKAENEKLGYEGEVAT